MSAPLNQITVEVHSRYLPEQSQPDENRFAFAYHVTIRNLGSQSAQLLSRHWIITDGNGHKQEVRGPGVIGQQPHIASGASHSYSSGSLLSTKVGTMQGSYRMLAEDGTEFDAVIPPFRLAVPGALH